jgi:hypothetical protein
MFSFIYKLIRKVSRNLPAKDFSDFDLEYLMWIVKIYSRIEQIPGHIAEIGVASGRNSVLFGKLIKMHNQGSVRQYLGFDTFDGYNDYDLNRDSHLDHNEWKTNTKKSVLQRCSINDVDDVVEIIEGDALKTVPHTLRQHTGKKFQAGKAKFALLYIDCNAYNPAIESMRSFLPFMMPGGLIVIDEKLQGGETEALLEFARENNLSISRQKGNSVPMFIQINNLSV